MSVNTTALALEQTIYKTVLQEGLPANMANLVTAQAKHESGNFTSNVFKTCNNLFGYKYVGQALATKGIPAPAKEGDYYAKYKTPADSARELTGWIKRRVKEQKFPSDLTTIKTPAQYAALLKSSNYYGDNVSNYTAGLTRAFKDFGSAAAAGISTVAVLAIAAGLWFMMKK